MKKLALIITIALVLAIIPSIKAETGTIRIETPEGEYWPIMLGSPSTFEIWVQGAGNPTSDPHILLVMSEACHLGLTGDVVVTWTGGSVSFASGDFTGVTTNSDDVPPPDAYPVFKGASYTVASLKDHLSYGLIEPINSTETIYWAWKPFLGGAALIHDHQSFTVDLPSTEPRMLVYALGKSNGSTLFDNKVPPTRPGFMVPEPSTVLIALAAFSAFILYAVKPKRFV